MTDTWADWLRSRRAGGDPELEARILAQLGKGRDRVLDNAGLRPGETLLDVGSGNGLIAFGALERGAGEVVFADVSRPLLAKARAVYDAIQPETDPMVDFDERDLLTLAADAGFFPVTLDYRARIEPPEPRRWETFLHSSGNPKIPTFAEAMAESLTDAERDRLEAALRTAVEEGRGEWRMGEAYLWAVKQ